MRITRIDFEGEFGNFATAVRKRDSQYVEVTILTPGMPDGREHSVQADSEEDIYSWPNACNSNSTTAKAPTP